VTGNGWSDKLGRDVAEGAAPRLADAQHEAERVAPRLG